MRRTLGLATVVFLAACGGDQSAVEPCTIRVNVIEIPNVQVNATRLIDADVEVRAGTCSPGELDLSWASSKPDIAQITASSNEGATITGRRAGSSTISAWLTRSPSVRDSISVNIVNPVDN